MHLHGVEAVWMNQYPEILVVHSIPLGDMTETDVAFSLKEHLVPDAAGFVIRGCHVRSLLSHSSRKLNNYQPRPHCIVPSSATGFTAPQSGQRNSGGAVMV